MKVSFCGYKFSVKTAWRKGEIPNVTRGLYGDILTQENLSAEHLLPVSKGGLTIDSNLALATKQNNSLRGNQDLREVLSQKQALDYIKQFGAYKQFVQYINDILRTFEKLGVIK